MKASHEIRITCDQDRSSWFGKNNKNTVYAHAGIYPATDYAYVIREPLKRIHTRGDAQYNKSLFCGTSARCGLAKFVAMLREEYPDAPVKIDEYIAWQPVAKIIREAAA